MAGGSTRSPLAQKALAQKAQREKQAQEAVNKEQAAQLRVEMLGEKWADIKQELLQCCNDINAELTGTGTSISPNKAPDSPKGLFSGEYVITIMREGVSDRSQTFTLRFSKTGTLIILEALGMGRSRGEHHIEAEDLERGSVDTYLRAFVNAALS